MKRRIIVHRTFQAPRQYESIKIGQEAVVDVISEEDVIARAEKLEEEINQVYQAILRKDEARSKPIVRDTFSGGGGNRG